MSSAGICNDNHNNNDPNDINIIERCIQCMEQYNGLCIHPYHYHSFQIPPNFFTTTTTTLFNHFFSTNNNNSNTTTTTINNKTIPYVKPTTCILCNELFNPPSTTSLNSSSSSSSYIPNIFHRNKNNQTTTTTTGSDSSSSTTAVVSKTKEPLVQCLACYMYAHRSCATSNNSVNNIKLQNQNRDNNIGGYEMNQICSVNYFKINQRQQQEQHLISINNDGDEIDEQQHQVQPPVSIETTNADTATVDNIVFLQRQEEPALSSTTTTPPVVRKVSLFPGNRKHEMESKRTAVKPPTDSVKNIDIVMESQQQRRPDYKNNKIITAMKENVSITAVAGGIAGGIAGMALIGPAGAVYACYLGAGGINVLLGLESAASLSMIVAGIATGTVTGKQIQDHMDNNNQRILTMLDPNRRTVLLVRPNIPTSDVDLIWQQIYTDAIQSAPKSILIQQQQQQKIRRRGKRNGTMINDADIICTNEDEINTSDKVLLLVSRLLNDKTSLPGYIFRYFIECYNDRCTTSTSRRNRTTTSTESILTSDSEQDGTNHVRVRRDDVHAIIRHVSLLLIELRPELGTTIHITELTACAVENIIFGQVYNSVMDEIMNETCTLNDKLQRKVTLLEQVHPELFESNKVQETLLPTHIEELNNDENNETGTIRYDSDRVTVLHNLISEVAIMNLKMISQSRSVSDKLHFCVKFIDSLSNHYTSLSTVTTIIKNNNNDDNNNNNNNSNSNEQNNNDDIDDSAKYVCADTLIQMVCQHIIFLYSRTDQNTNSNTNDTTSNHHHHQADQQQKQEAEEQSLYPNLLAQMVLIEEFARDEQLVHGYDGYALVTIQASLHILQQEQVQDTGDDDDGIETLYKDLF